MGSHRDMSIVSDFFRTSSFSACMALAKGVKSLSFLEISSTVLAARSRDSISDAYLALSGLLRMWLTRYANGTYARYAPNVEERVEESGYLASSQPTISTTWRAASRAMGESGTSASVAMGCGELLSSVAILRSIKMMHV